MANDVQGSHEVIGDSKWYQCTLKEACVQDALNNYLCDYPYLDGYSPSQIDVKVHQAFNELNVNVSSYPHLHRWYKHVVSFSEQERASFRAEQGKILPRCACKASGDSKNDRQVR